ncbi:hypothetical protein M9Y10_008076 [Tritrichomonas musculus]|uniref:Uncharacterized protein n=1 Tax=Tritrichomonas musculus TaxID=1915356 RepID=A0ABR2IX97_9EUKA
MNKYIWNDVLCKYGCVRFGKSNDDKYHALYDLRSEVLEENESSTEEYTEESISNESINPRSGVCIPEGNFAKQKANEPISSESVN